VIDAELRGSARTVLEGGENCYGWASSTRCCTGLASGLQHLQHVLSGF
jgi:hypothetical protein